MKNLIFAALLGSTALVTSAAVAQQQTGQDAMQTQQTGQAAGQEQTATGSQMEMQDGFIIAQQQDQMIGSNLMDAEVVGADNESIGNIDDLLLDREGRVAGVIVGVGGFLEIGEKDVAIPAESLDFVLAGDPEAMNAGAAGTAQTGAAGTTGTATTAQPGAAGTGAAGTAGTAADGAAVAPGTATGTAQPGAGTGATGATGTGGAAGTSTTGMAGTAGTAMDPARMGAGWGWTGEQIDHIRVDFTREQLEAAPEFTSIED